MQYKHDTLQPAAYSKISLLMETLMASAIAAKHQWMAEQAKAGGFKNVSHDAASEGDWQAYADALLALRKL